MSGPNPGVEPLLRLERVGKRYPGGRDALDDISFSLAPGEVAFVVGHSGAGKSTLLRLLSLQDRATRGTIWFEGRNLGALKTRHLPHARRRIGMVFQDHRLLMDRSVFDNVALPCVIAGMPRAERERRVRAALDKVGLLEREAHPPDQLSTGEQQRVGIARALVVRPPLVVADEPTGNLDPALSAQIMGLFCSFGAVGTTVLIASHDLPLVQRMRKRVLVLEHGRLIDDFRPDASAH